MSESILELTDYKHVAMICPKCGAKLNGSIGFGNECGSRGGDKKVCSSCANVLVYDSGGKLRLITDDELATLALDYPKSFSTLLRLQNAAVTVIRKKHIPEQS